MCVIAGGIESFAGARVLLLQGPVGPFFARFARDLAAVGARVSSIVFNGGDWLFQPRARVWRGPMADWPDWLAAHLADEAIDVVFLFGDCRPIHREVQRVASRLGVAVGVFEEGYVRPDFITLERHGVNGNSLLRYDHDGTLTLPAQSPAVRPVPPSFRAMVLWGFVYFTAAACARPLFPHYRHHRPIRFAEALPWLRSPLRKAWYDCAERGITARLTGAWSGRFFLVPLQVHNDAQVLFHANTGGVRGFIASTIASFGRTAPADAVLVFKHHPMDRGYRDYTRAIARAARAAGCGGRVITIHDQPMEAILPHCRGTVVINSTAGLAAICCGRPTIALGEAVYALPGLTFQGSLDCFWTEAAAHAPDRQRVARFRAALIAATQINGNFYRRLDPQGSATGLIWPPLQGAGADSEAPIFRFTGSSTAPLAAGLQAPASP